jgi:hypothetical protein
MLEFCWNDRVIMSQSRYVMPIKKVAGTFRHGGEWLWRKRSSSGKAIEANAAFVSPSLFHDLKNETVVVRDACINGVLR